jgi:hypothetical protein
MICDAFRLPVLVILGFFLRRGFKPSFGLKSWDGARRPILEILNLFLRLSVSPALALNLETNSNQSELRLI